MTDQPSRLNPANGLPLLRLVLVPVFAWILLSHPHDLWWRLGSTALFGLAIATDALDGRIARKYNLITDFGKLWDSIADKALTGMAFIGLSILGELPWWITVAVLVREWGITIMRFVVIRHGVMPAGRGGKTKTALQSVALTLFILPLWTFPAAEAVQVIAWIVMTAAVVLTLVTGIDIVLKALRLRQTSERAAMKRARRAGGNDH